MYIVHTVLELITDTVANNDVEQQYLNTIRKPT